LINGTLLSDRLPEAVYWYRICVDYPHRYRYACRYFPSYSATIYANVQKDKIIDKGDINIANGALVGLYVASIIFLIMGFAGIYGIDSHIQVQSKRINSCYLCSPLELSSSF
jgi:hypothetical protein